MSKAKGSFVEGEGLVCRRVHYVEGEGLICRRRRARLSIAKGSFVEGEGLLLQKGVCIGTSTNNTAESFAMATAVKTCLRYYFWMAERLSQLAQRSVRE